MYAIHIHNHIGLRVTTKESVFAEKQRRRTRIRRTSSPLARNYHNCKSHNDTNHRERFPLPSSPAYTIGEKEGLKELNVVVFFEGEVLDELVDGGALHDCCAVSALHELDVSHHVVLRPNVLFSL